MAGYRTVTIAWLLLGFAMTLGSALGFTLNSYLGRHFHELHPLPGFSSVSMADRILVIDHGKIIEEGMHTQLLAQSGHYASLYRLANRHLEEA
jgi:hypothetical protein